MNRIIGGILKLILFAVLLVGVSLGVLWWYINSAKFKSQLVEQTARYTTTEPFLGSFSPRWSGLEADEFYIPNEAPHADRFIGASHMVLKVRWSTLLSSNPIIDGLIIDSPSVSVHQTASGALALPLKNKPSGDGPRGFALTPDFQLDNIDLSDGSFVLRTADSEELVRAEGFNLDGNLAMVFGSWRAEAAVTLEKLTVFPGLTLRDVQSPLTYIDNDLVLPEITAAAYSGTVRGNSKLSIAGTRPSFGFDLNAEGLELDAILTDLDVAPGTAQGTLAIRVSGAGAIAEPRQLLGRGNFTLQPARIPKLQAARVLGSLLGIREIENGTFESIISDFEIRNETVHLDNLVVRGENLSIELRGTVDFNKQLDLKGNVVLAPGAALSFASLFGETADSVRQETRRLPITITGPAQKPNISLDPAGTGLEVGREVWKRLMGTDNKSDSTGQPGNPDSTKKPSGLESILEGILGR